MYPYFLYGTLENSGTVLSGIVEKALRPLENDCDGVIWYSSSLNVTVESTKMVSMIEFGSLFFNAVRTLVKAVMAKTYIAGSVLTGGDTTFNACKELNITAKEIVGEVQSAALFF